MRFEAKLSYSKTVYKLPKKDNADLFTPPMSTFSQSTGSPFRVGLLLIDGFSLLTYSSAVEPLRAANQISGESLYEIWNIPAQGARARASCGALVPANAHVGERLGFDLVLVVASSDSLDAKQPRLLDWLRQLSRRKIILGGLAAGPLMLARAGLLRNRTMTLHWSFRDALIESQPELSVVRNLFVIDRDRVTCSGGTAPVDLMHAMIASQHGIDFAHTVSDWFSHAEVRSEKSPQRAGKASRYRTKNADVLAVIELMECHLSDTLDLSQLSLMVGVSQRHLNRLFKQQLSLGTMEFYRHLRLQRSHQLLTQSSLSITHIGAATGFTNSAHFSRSYKKQFNQTPSEARALG